MKVLHVMETVRGGLASYVGEFSDFQIARYGADGVRFAVPLGGASDIPGVPTQSIFDLPPRSRSPLTFVRLFLQVLKVLRTYRPDLVHAHSTFAGVAVRLAAQAVSPRPKVVYCAHGWSFLMNTSPLKKWVYLTIERALAPFADAIISISHNEHKRASEQGITGDRHVMIYNGVAPLTSVPNAGVNLPTDRMNLLFVGRFDTQKGMDTLMAAMTILEDMPCHLYTIGAGVLGSLELAARPNVTHLGWRDRAEIDSYYLAADAVVMPSRWEGFGLVAVEAMRCRTAVLASHVGALPEIVADGETGRLFTPDDPSGLADLIRGVSRDTLQTWGQAGAARQAELFSADHMNANLAALYERLAPRASAGAVS